MESNDAAACFAALGQPTRLGILRHLLAAGPSGRQAGELAETLGVPQSTLSFHIRSLEAAELVQVTRQGRFMICAARIDRVRRIVTFLLEVCCDGDPARCGDFARLLDTTAGQGAAPGPFHVLFLCTRNSARSIMAEAILNGLGDGRFRAFSAGSHPSAEGPMPEVLAQLKALGHDVSGLRSKCWDAFAGPNGTRIDFVIALCDTLQGQACPDFGKTVITAAWPLPDPAKFTGSAAERATLLNELAAALHRRLSLMVALPVRSLDRMALKARLDELADPHALTRA
ncbi:metalloregulator ArsR/SmtB family transcription factor [Roseomonas sp. SSH11]|uniref:Metalloregulator ArsR/SmtB family transcription factor n=1 Tax=Pararoseomonas baculiformis TaxID=2820812 RepID=A0ABS4AIZ0_9PROT|nr:metalloregulator ArsR/SmtB family transcription factor [Pararoseomonas baculiformis]MBP0446975.1 metalloregulator ArsR/SmtB family transcription factor [Pararoseomonas baculiformis]